MHYLKSKYGAIKLKAEGAIDFGFGLFIISHYISDHKVDFVLVYYKPLYFRSQSRFCACLL